jgi:hypothetical protein
VNARLFHFSDDPSIDRFVPRPVRVPSERPAGMEWLNGPLVWTVTEQRQAAYLFPRDCPRILLWLTPTTTDEDRRAWWGERDASMIACVEWRWLDALRATELFRYELPAETFRPIEDDGWMQVSDREVAPIGVDRCGDLLEAHARLAVELRFMDSLRPLADVWSTSLHASGIRLRNAHDWE